jgi:hypothetical protein
MEVLIYREQRQCSVRHKNISIICKIWYFHLTKKTYNMLHEKLLLPFSFFVFFEPSQAGWAAPYVAVANAQFDLKKKKSKRTLRPRPPPKPSPPPHNAAAAGPDGRPRRGGPSPPSARGAGLARPRIRRLQAVAPHLGSPVLSPPLPQVPPKTSPPGILRTWYTLRPHLLPPPYSAPPFPLGSHGLPPRPRPLQALWPDFRVPLWPRRLGPYDGPPAPRVPAWFPPPRWTSGGALRCTRLQSPRLPRRTFPCGLVECQ